MRISIALLLVLVGISSFSQEVLVGLQVNPVVKKKSLEFNRLKESMNGLDTLPMALPFFDDFRVPTVYPDPERWIDRYAFVNTDIPVFPVNRGAATMDAISDSGQMYSWAVPGPTTFPADLLTSRYIRLDSVFSPVPKAIIPADSVYLSFWYQPQGRGKPPHTGDSLLLQFLVKPAWDSITPTDTFHFFDTWKQVWGTKGMSLDTFYLHHNRYFVQVMIPITDTSFFKKKFRFQFYNWVSLASSAEPSWQSNCSQWNIDEVYLNYRRTYTDTLIPEITFIERPPSMLKRYASMPYPQYSNDPTNEMDDTLNILISNRDLENHNSTYNYLMSTPNGSWQKEYNGGQYTIKPFYTTGYVTYIPFAHPPVSYLFPVSTQDSAVYTLTHRVAALDGSNLGDTMQANQVFYNYYAYDDGSPDAGYGLTPAGSMLAYRFKLNKSPDTLRAVQFYFNQTLSGDNVQYFYLTVWNDNNGKPGDTLYQDLELPMFADSLNQFVTYHLDFPLRISGSFYVGWRQTTDDNLNLGFDRYNNSQEEIFYNATGVWTNSSFSGSLMIRPIVGKPIPLGIPEVQTGPGLLRVYPNPVSSGRVTIDVPSGYNETDKLYLTIYNLFGQKVYGNSYTRQPDLSLLPPGIYFVTLYGSADQPIANAKLVITR
ncbi:MAG: T9SS type A sorting domain-containing protein [bacterium]